MSYAIPDELNFESVSRMYPSVKTEYRRPPRNNTTFSTGDINLVMNKINNAFANPTTLVLNFEVAYTFANTGGTATTANTECIYLLGNAYSHFSRQVLAGAGNSGILESIENPALLVNAMLNLTTSVLEKKNMISLGCGVNNNETNLGICIPVGAMIATTGTNTVYRTYSIPIVGALNASKLIPLFVSDLELTMTLNNTANYIVSSSASVTTSVAINRVELVYDMLTLENSGFQQMLQMYPQIMQIKTTSYKYGASSLPNGAGRSTYEIVYAHQVNSLKKFIMWCAPSDQYELNYGGVNPNLQDFGLVINSTVYPQQRLKVPKLADMYYQISKSFGSVYSTGHSGSMDRNSFSKCALPATGSTVTREYIDYCKAINSGTFPSASPSTANLQSSLQSGISSTMSNKFYISIDVESINQLKNSIYSGIPSRGSTNSIILNIGEPLPSTSGVTFALHYFSEYDLVLNFDHVNGIITTSE